MLPLKLLTGNSVLQPTKDELVAKLDDINAAVDELTAKVTAPKENVQT